MEERSLRGVDTESEQLVLAKVKMYLQSKTPKKQGEPDKLKVYEQTFERVLTRKETNEDIEIEWRNIVESIEENAQRIVEMKERIKNNK